MATLNASQQARLASQQAQLAGGAAGRAATQAALNARGTAVNAANAAANTPGRVNFNLPGVTPKSAPVNNAPITFGEKLGATYKPKTQSIVPGADNGVIGSGQMSSGGAVTSGGSFVKSQSQTFTPTGGTVPNQVTNINQSLTRSETIPQEVQQPTMAVSSEQVGTTPTATKEYRFFDDYKDSDYFNGLGSNAEPILDFIEEYEKKTGKKVHTKTSEFQKLMNQHLTDKASWQNIMNRFAWKESVVQPKIDEPSTTAKEFPKVDKTEEDRTSQDVATLLNDEGSDTLHSQLAQLFDLDPKTPGEALIRNSLMLSLGAIDDPQIAAYLDHMESRATAAYEDGMAKAKLGKEELDKAIDGVSFDAETYEGSMAKLENKYLNLYESSLNETKSYLEAKHGIDMQQARDKRADLEGYAKAKLYSMGAQDSSAGIALVAKIVSEADLQIQLAETEYTHSIVQLNQQGAEVMLNYTKDMTNLIESVRSKEDKVTETYNTTLDAIENQRFTNDAQKRKDTLLAYKEYNDNLGKYREEQKQAELDAVKTYTEQAEKLRDYAIKVAGVTGTIWVPNADGSLTDTGLPTFEAKKYASDYQKSVAQLQVSSDTQRRLSAKNLLDAYGSSAAPMVEQLMGLPSGSLEGYQTVDEIKNAIDMIAAESKALGNTVQDNADYSNGQAINDYLNSGAGVKTGGLKIDPFSLPDVRTYLLGSSAITQKYLGPGGGGTYTDGSHPAIDVVYKDGNVHAVRGGTVVNIIPWNGTDPYGSQVWVKDSTGLTWRYAHLGSRTKGGNPFNVQVGQTVNQGDTLGRQGNTGQVVSRKSPSDPTYGVHTHIQIVGYEKPMNWKQGMVSAAGTVLGMAETMTGGLYKSPIEQPTHKPTLKDLQTLYFESFGKEATGADLETLKIRGMSGLQTMIDKRSKSTTDTVDYNLALNSAY